MKLPLITINAFAPGPFLGNPAAVVLSQSALEPAQMQAIAAQNNLAETAFLVPHAGADADFSLRWFTPAVEVPLCGHATLASAHALAQHFGFTEPEIRFSTQQSGILTAKMAGDAYELSFPAHTQSQLEINEVLAGLNLKIQAAFGGPFILLVAADAAAVKDYRPDFDAILALNKETIITAQGDGEFGEYDFVSRMFAPNIGIDEDPVTGSAHCQLAPYWASVLGKTTLRAAQIGPRWGEMEVELAGDRILMRGTAQTYAVGEISL